ncbi:MAG: FAD binding domain-containing protein [Gammaproteobacteria bacterium]|jgi:2-polyprenyl-6-methoxyphenol hydroxylase-like FAD-dependent oxidoreductase
MNAPASTAASPTLAESRGRIAIIGGSIAGLLAGLLLLRNNWDVQIYERSGDELASRGAGITPHRALFDACAQAGIDLADTIGVESAGRIMLSHNGEVVASNDMHQLFTSWGLLYRSLRAAFPDDRYHNGAGVREIRTGNSAVRLTFDQGTTRSADWVIGADGLRSLVRRSVSPDSRLHYAGYVAWRGLVVESMLPAALRRQLERGMTFFVPADEHVLGYTVAGPGDTRVRGERWYNWVWYRPLPAGPRFDATFTDEDGTLHAHGIPPPRIRRAVVDALRADAATRLPPQFRAVVLATEQPFLQAIVEFGSEQLVRGRCVLIGDAAFTARPHIGLGVSKAAGDASTLSRAFAQGESEIPAALARWENARLDHGRAALARSAVLGCYIGNEPADDEQARRYAHYRSPDVVLAEIAAAEPAAEPTHPAEKRGNNT